MRRLIALLGLALAMFGVVVLIGLLTGNNAKLTAGCIPSSQIVKELRAAKPGGENFQPPYDKAEIATIKTQEVAWAQVHLDDPCARSMAAHVKVKPTNLPGWLQKASLQRVGKTNLGWFMDGKQVFSLSGVYSPPSKAKAAAIPKAKYFADKAPPGSNQFGPDVRTHKLSTVVKMFKANGVDPLYVPTLAHFKVHPNLATFPIRHVEAIAKTYAKNGVVRQQAFKGILSRVKSYSIKYDQRSYESLGMVPHGGKLPTLFRATEYHPVGWALFLHFKNGQTLELRVACHFQPVQPLYYGGIGADG